MRTFFAVIGLTILFSFPNQIFGADAQSQTQPASPLKVGYPEDVKGPPPSKSLYDEGFWQITEDDKLRIWAWAQEDFRVFDANYPGDDTFLNRRVRLAALGTLKYHFNYMIMAALERSTLDNLINIGIVQFAWIEYAQLSWAKARVGQFKEPFSLEELTLDPYIDFLERSIITTNFSPAHDLGAMLHGYLWENRIEYGVGAFNGRGKNREDNTDDKDIAGRVVLQPFEIANIDLLKKLWIGVDGTWGRNDESLAGVSYRTAGRSPFWTYASNTSFNDNRWRLGVDLEWLYGPFSLKSEWGHSTFEGIRNLTQEADGKFDGWYVSATWLVTGGTKTRGNKPTIPNKNFDPFKNTWGAFEIGFRYEQLIASGTPIERGLATGTDHVDALTVGLTWFFNKLVRGGFNYERSIFEDAVVIDNKSVRNEDLYLFRAQFEI